MPKSLAGAINLVFSAYPQKYENCSTLLPGRRCKSKKGVHNMWFGHVFLDTPRGETYKNQFLKFGMFLFRRYPVFYFRLLNKLHKNNNNEFFVINNFTRSTFVVNPNLHRALKNLAVFLSY
jgi:hypothetical protein